MVKLVSFYKINNFIFINIVFNIIFILYSFHSAPKRIRTLRFAEPEDSGKENKTTDDIEMFMREVSIITKYN